MKLMKLVVAVVLAVVAAQGLPFASRLCFRNVTQGTSNAGALLARPGDSVAIHFYFQVGSDNIKSQLLQFSLSLDGTSLMSDTDANTFVAQAKELFRHGQHPTQIFYQPSLGPMHDDALDPSDPAADLVCIRGISAMVTTAEDFQDDFDIFSFTIQPGSQGQNLAWLFPGRATDYGLSTRLMAVNKIQVCTDNYVQVVPEPAAIVAGLVLLAGLRRRR